MTPALVLDASAAGAVLFREPDAVLVAPHLFRVQAVAVPQIFHLEVASIGRTKVLRSEMEAQAAVEILSEVDAWPVEVRSVAWRDAWAVAARAGLTVYDAAYLELARKLRLRLLTLDHALIRAAGRASLL